MEQLALSSNIKKAVRKAKYLGTSGLRIYSSVGANNEVVCLCNGPANSQVAGAFAHLQNSLSRS